MSLSTEVLDKFVRAIFRPPLKTFEQYQYESALHLDRRLIEELKTGEYIRNRRTMILSGKTGTGKTPLAIALGIEACRLEKLPFAWTLPSE